MVAVIKRCRAQSNNCCGHWWCDAVWRSGTSL